MRPAGDPAPAPDPDPSALEPRAAYELCTASDWPNPLMRAEQRAMLGLLPLDLRGRTALDAACGTGRYLHLLRARGARPAIGIDLAQAMLRRASPAAPGSLLLQGRIEQLPVRSGWADVAVCALAAGYVHPLQAALAELCRVLRPGGLLLCSDLHPAGQALGWRRQFRVAGRTLTVRAHWHTLADWRSACRTAGLQILQCLEPRLEPDDLDGAARPEALPSDAPVALVLALRRSAAE